MKQRVVVRRGVGLVVALACAAGAVWASTVDAPQPVNVQGRAASTTTGGPDQRSSPAGPSSTSTATDPTSTANPTESPAPSTGSPSSGPSPERTTGPGLSAPGTYLIARPDSSGILEVVERFRFNTTLSRFTLSLGAVPDLLGLGGLKPRVTDLQVQAGTQPVIAPTTLTSTDVVEVVLPTPSQEVLLRYRLSAVVRSNPSPIGRALAVIAPIASDPAGGGPVLFDVAGTSVRNVVCPQLVRAIQTCGTRRGTGWSAGPMPRSQAVVVAQIDLPRPGDQ